MIEDKYRVLSGRFDGAALRLWAALGACALGRGGVSIVAKAIGMSRMTIYAGMKKLVSATPPPVVPGSVKCRVRAKGGGRRRLMTKDPTLLQDLDALVEPVTLGDPQSPLR